MKRILLFLLISSGVAHVTIAQTTSQPAKPTRFDTLMNKYRADEASLSGDEMIYLATVARKAGANKLSKEISSKYINKLSEKAALTRSNILFICGNTNSTSDRGFTLLRSHAAEMDQVLNNSGFAEKAMSDIIMNENADILTSAKEPDWASLQKGLAGKFDNNIAERTIALEKMQYYKSQKDWVNYTTATSSMLSKYAKDYSLTDINNFGWDVFSNASDVASLALATTWLKPVVENSKTSYLYIDTYANLLYKLNKKDEAISWESKALALSPADQDIAGTLDKMKKGEKTW